MMKASAYPLLDVDQAARLVLERTPGLGTERVPLGRAAGRVLARDLVSAEDLPRWRTSAVDGYAVRAADAGGRLTVAGESAAGRPFAAALEPGQAVRILTGGVVPTGADVVVMHEDTNQFESEVRVPPGLVPGANIHFPGADLAAGEVVVEAGSELGPAEVGLAGTLGYRELDVFSRPRVALLSTGDELVEVGAPLGPAQVPDSNRFALDAALREAGAEVLALGIGPDEPAPLRALVTAALESADALVTSGGVSVGTHDLVKPLLEELGEIHIGRVNLKPGKPFTFATLAEGRLAFGLPGFPVSSLVTFEVFVRPALRRMQGYAQPQRPRLPVRLGFPARASGDRTEFHRVRLHREEDELVAESTGSQSSSRLKSLVGAQALARIPPGPALPAGSRVEALILSLP